MTEEKKEIDRIKAAKEAIATAIADKGVTVPVGAQIDGMAGLIAAIESGGGMPNGVSALATGTITPTENNTSGVEIEHDLGVVPNFFVWIAEKDLSTEVENTAAVEGATIVKKVKLTASASSIYTTIYVVGGYNASGMHGGTYSRSNDKTYMTEKVCIMKATSTYPIKAGITYRWVCGVMDGVL